MMSGTAIKPLTKSSQSWGTCNKTAALPPISDHGMTSNQHTVSAWSHLHAERFAEAVTCAKQAIDFNPSFPDSHAILASAAAHLGRMTEAQSGLNGFVQLLPGISLNDQRLIRPFRRPVDRERFLAGLQKAGLQEQCSSAAT